jgi:serine/threonine-protein kinase
MEPIGNPFTNLLKRKVVQWAIGYAAVGAVLVEVLDVVGGRFHWPEFVLEASIVLVASGLFVTLVLAWFHGEKGRQEVSGAEMGLLFMILVGAGTTLWLVRGEGEAPSLALATELLGPPEPTAWRVAVLPFANLSGEGEGDAYLVDGLHDEIITQVSKVSALEVVSRTSVLSYRTPEGKNAREIGAELGVWYILEGTFRRIEEHIRVTAQLIDTRTDRHLWVETYDGAPTAAALFDLQSDVAVQVAQALQATLLPSELTRIGKTYTHDDQAYWSYLQGLRAMRGNASVNIPRALDAFRNAVELDPLFALGWEALAGSYVTMGNYFLADPEDVFPLAEEAALRALELDESLTDARVWLAWVQFSFHRNWEETERILREVLGQNRASVLAHYLLGYYLQAMGRYGEAVREGQFLTRLDPKSGGSHRAAARMLHMARRFSDAKEVMNWAMALTPSATGGFFYQALTLEQLDRPAEAVAELQRAALGSGRDAGEVAALGDLFDREGMAGVWRQWLDWHLADDPVRPGPLAIAHARMGEAEEAVRWLRQGMDVYESWLFQLNDPLWDPIRDSPGFREILQELGLPEG